MKIGTQHMHYIKVEGGRERGKEGWTCQIKVEGRRERGKEEWADLKN